MDPSIKLPTWIQELIDKGGEVSECLELLKKMTDIEREERLAERDMKKTAMETEVKMKELELKNRELALRESGAAALSPSPTDGSNRVKFSLPKFVEGQDVDVFLKSFEKLAKLHKWKKEDWSLRLVPQLTGKALEAYSRLTDEDSSDYEKIKKAIPKRYDLTSEAYRTKFRNASQETNETFREFCVREKTHLNHWCESEKIGSSYEKLYDLILREQLLKSAPTELRVWLKERQPESVNELVDMAEAYQVAHRQVHTSVRSKSRFEQKSESKFEGKSDGQSQRGNFRNVKVCDFCGKKGHVLKDCFARFKGESSEGSKRGSSGMDKKGTSSAFVHVPKGEVNVGTVEVPVEGRDEVVVNKTPGLRLANGIVNGEEVSVLRDTGSTSIFVASRLVASSHKTEHTREVTLANGSKCVCPEVWIEVDTPYISGKVLALVMDTPFTDLIVGNQGQIQVPVENNSKQDTCNAVETRRQKEMKEAEEVSSGKSGNVDLSSVPKETLREDLLAKTGKKELIKEQQADPSLSKMRMAASTERPQEGKSIFKYDSGLLYRVHETEKGETYKQIVVPHRYRDMILSLGHDIPLGGHLGIRKTRARILQHFFWPSVFDHVADYCRSCPQCQKVTAKGRVGTVPLVQVPSMEEPFKRIAIDFVGPLPRSEKGNKYILVVCDYATRYPEAVPLKSQEAEVVAEALIEIFARVGIPQEILSDQGTNFMSILMKELCRLLNIRKLTSSPYRPQTNGLVEKFNGTLKRMLRCYAQEQPKLWDKYVPFVLFAYREVPQESIGFSPFELLYGRHIRGPLSVLKETWEEPDENKVQPSVISYIMETREKLSKMAELARTKEEESKRKQKVYYDKKTRKRELRVGQKVLVLLPTSSSKLLAKWKGPYDVVEKVGPVDYKVKISKDVVKTYHINMLKQWFDREGFSEKGEVLSCLDVICAMSGSPGDEVSEEVLVDNPLLVPSEAVDNVKLSDDLSPVQRQQLLDLCRKYEDVLTDVPGKTDMIKHSVKVTNEEPIHQKPYPIPYALREQVQKEVQQMLDAGIVEHSSSPWAAPVVLVRKKDNTIRFCVDYRRLNSVTVFDPRPMPRIEEILNKLGKAQFLSKIDLTKGYWQIPLDDDAKEKSAFVLPFGNFHFTVMPFGMVNSGGSFVRLITKVLERLSEFADSFVDDIIIFSGFWDSHLLHLEAVFESLRRAKLTAKPSKCSLGNKKMEFLAHLVGEGKIQPTDEKVIAIKKMTPPRTKKEVKSFLGTVGFYRRFICDFSNIAAPLTDLTSKARPSKVRWTDDHQRAFDELKRALTCKPVLWNPDFSKNFILQTDASDRGLGAILSQDHHDGRHPIAYLSRKLLPREQSYAVVEKECLAIVWAVKALQVYLLGKEFLIECDHHGLQWLQTMKSQNQRLLRWSLALQEYKYRVRYIPGCHNKMADTLSRNN